MAWTHYAWDSQSTDASRLSELREHVAEVSASVEGRADAISSDGKTMTRPQLMEYLRILLEQRDRLEGKLTRSAAGGRSYARLSRPRN